MEKDRDTLVLYTTAVCNLNCRYCYIDKNEALKHIDDILDESFQGDYYIDFIREMFPRKSQLKRIETWGGEPFLRMDRIYPTLHKVIENYPFFDQMYSSTNFSFPEWPEQFFGLMDQFGKYPDRHFTYLLQLSMDGPEYINDYGRGTGTTEKCLKNFDALVNGVGNRLPPNVTLDIVFKPTLDLNSTKMLDSKEKIIEYYSFFENLIEKVWDLDYSNVHAFLPVPNTACPSPVTIEDGKIFAELCRMCGEIERENKDGHILKYYRSITPFAGDSCVSRPLTYRYPNFTCGTGYTVLGLLPNKMVSACHNGFVDLISDYKRLITENKGKSSLDFEAFCKNQPAKFTMTVEKFETYERQMSCYNCLNTSARLANIVELINMLAFTKQIDPKYRDQKEALRAGIFIQTHTSYCVRDNYATTGSITLFPVGIIKLLLNGAKEYIEENEGK